MQNRNNTPGALQRAVEKTEDVHGAFCDGLRAIKNADRPKFDLADTRQIGGSVDIDSATKVLYPLNNRWDYAIEYKNETYFAEVHPAATSEVDTVIKKLDWLKAWLKDKAPEINKIKAKESPYIWLYTNRFDILPTSTQYKKIAQQGLIPKAKWEM